MWVRGLKHLWCAPNIYPHVTSHPMWVRGLKLIMKQSIRVLVRRTPCGCVD